MRKENAGVIGAIIAVSICCIVTVLILTGSLGVLTGFFKQNNIYLIIGIIIVLAGVIFYWKKRFEK